MSFEECRDTGLYYFYKEVDKDYHATMQFEEAHKWFQSALSVRPLVHELLFLKASSFWNIFIDKENYENWAAGFFARERTPEQAFREIETAIKLNPDEHAEYFFLAAELARKLMSASRLELMDKHKEYIQKAASLGHQTAIARVKTLGL